MRAPLHNSAITDAEPSLTVGLLPGNTTLGHYRPPIKVAFLFES